MCGYLFAPDTAGRPIEAETAAAWLEAKADGSFLWLHFNTSNAAAERWIVQKLALPDAFHESLHAELGSTRVEQSGDWLLANLNDVLFDFAFDASHVSSMSLCAERRLMVSARAKALRWIDRLREEVRRGETLPLDRRPARAPAARPGRGDGPDRARLDDAR